MKQFFEVFLSVIIIMVIVTLSSQGVLINSTISTAREYHNTIIEKIENSGLDEEYMKTLVESTAQNTKYTLSIDPVDGANNIRSYHVQLKYPVKSILYNMFGGKYSSGMATIDGYASVGKESYSVYVKGKDKEDEQTIGKGLIATLYEGGYLVIDGSTDENTITRLTIDKKLIKHIIISGEWSIPANYFADCENLESVNLGNVKFIGREAFGNCVSLKDILIPSSATHLDQDIFKGCEKLKFIYIDNAANDVTIEGSIEPEGDTFVGIVYLK